MSKKEYSLYRLIMMHDPFQNIAWQKSLFITRLLINSKTII